MTHRRILALTFATLMLALPHGAVAQDTTTSETTAQSGASDLSLGQTVLQVGTIYTRDTYGDWEVRCSKTADGKDPCRLYQLMQDDKGNSVAEINLFNLPSGQAAVAGATIAVPLETLLTEQLTLGIDDGNAKRYPYSWCSSLGCYARIGLTAADIANFERGATGTVSIVPVAAPDARVALTMSLKGFTSGFAAVKKSNAAIAAN